MAKSRKKKNNLFSHTKSYSILTFKLYKRDYTIRNNKENKKNERQQLAKNTHNSMLYKKNTYTQIKISNQSNVIIVLDKKM